MPKLLAPIKNTDWLLSIYLFFLNKKKKLFFLILFLKNRIILKSLLTYKQTTKQKIMVAGLYKYKIHKQ